MHKLFLLALLFAVVSAQTCYLYNGCGSCTSHDGCGWCTSNTKCMPGDESGPENPTTPCKAANWNYGSCKPVTLKDGVPYSQKSQFVTSGGYDYYVYNVEDAESGVEIIVSSDVNGVQTMYMSQKYKVPRSNRYTWTFHSYKYTIVGNTTSPLNDGNLYISVYNNAEWGYTITVYNPPN